MKYQAKGLWRAKQDRKRGPRKTPSIKSFASVSRSENRGQIPGGEHAATVQLSALN